MIECIHGMILAKCGDDGCEKHAPKAGQKKDDGKPPTALIDADAMVELANILGFGAKKYAPNNWRKGISYTRVIGAILRHTWAILRGEDRDPEHGHLHAGAIMCEAMFLAFYQLHPDQYAAFDDRWKSKEETANERTAKTMEGCGGQDPNGLGR